MEQDHKDDINIAAQQAKVVIADAAELAAKTISDAAIIAAKVIDIRNSNDHDLLIELKIGNQFIRDDIKELSGSVTANITKLQESKAEKIDLITLADELHILTEKRLRKLEDKSFNVWIAFGFVMLGVGALFTIVIMHIFK